VDLFWGIGIEFAPTLKLWRKRYEFRFAPALLFQKHNTSNNTLINNKIINFLISNSRFISQKRYNEHRVKLFKPIFRRVKQNLPK